VLAIVSAMQEEIAALLDALSEVTSRDHGRRRFYRGTLHGMPVLAVFSRWGKVAAAATVTELIASYGVDELIFSGVAGALHPQLRIGDIVIGTQLIQHDLDASPIFPRYEVPLLGKAVLQADAALSARLTQAAQRFVATRLRASIATTELERFGIGTPRVLSGLIASGDKFFASSAELADLRARLPEAVCVEMEGAAVAQVCEEYAVRCAVVRTISDGADDNSAHDFPRFLRVIAGQYSAGILEAFLKER
jgi:adenosylhomocysteine nucleosidase